MSRIKAQGPRVSANSETGDGRVLYAPHVPNNINNDRMAGGGRTTLRNIPVP